MSHVESASSHNPNQEGTEPDELFPMIDPLEWTLNEYANSNAAHIMCNGKKIHGRSFPYDIAAEVVAAHQDALKLQFIKAGAQLEFLRKVIKQKHERIRGLIKNYRTLKIEHDDNVSALKEFSETIKQLGAKSKQRRENLEAATLLLEKVAPFVEVWQMQDLSDEIKNFLAKRRKDEGPPDNT